MSRPSSLDIPIPQSWTPPAHKRLLNAAEIARVTGFSTYTVNAVKNQRRVASPFCGKYTTQEKFEEWLLNNPWFKAVDYYRENAAEKAELAKLADLKAS